MAKNSYYTSFFLALFMFAMSLSVLADMNNVTEQLQVGAIIKSEEKGSINALWVQGGNDTTSRGDKVFWGYFHANPSDVTWGDKNNPDAFVKVWFDASGRTDVNFFHVSVPDILVSSTLGSISGETKPSTTNYRYVRHYYQDSKANAELLATSEAAATKVTTESQPTAYSIASGLQVGAFIETVEKGNINAAWKLGGTGVSARGDKVAWGYFYANPKDVSWGSANNPEVYVKIWFDVSGRVDVNFFHVSAPNIKVFSGVGKFDNFASIATNQRYTRHEYVMAKYHLTRIDRYDAEGSIIPLKVFSSDASGNLVKTDEYDYQGKLSQVTTFAYNAQNNLSSRQIDATEIFLNFKVTLDGTPEETYLYEYDSVGNISKEHSVQVRYEEGNFYLFKTSTLYTYDSRNRLIRSEEHGDNNWYDIHSYIYDSSGKLIKHSCERHEKSCAALLFHYDGDGREVMTEVYYDAAIDYEPDGTFPPDSILYYAYHPNGKIAEIKEDESGGLMSDATYLFSYDAQGRLAEQKHLDGDSKLRYTYTYKYDSNGNLEAESVFESGKLSYMYRYIWEQGVGFKDSEDVHFGYANPRVYSSLSPGITDY